MFAMYWPRASRIVASGRFRVRRTVRLSSFLILLGSTEESAAPPKRPSFGLIKRLIE
jgi:hypothetical protein